MSDSRKRKWSILCPVCGRESFTEQEYTDEELKLLCTIRVEGERIEVECNDCRLLYAEITGGGGDLEFI